MPGWLTRREAEGLAQTADRVIHRYYPRATDITADAPAIEALLRRVTPTPHLFEVGASRYHGSGIEVLVLEELH